MAQLDKAERDAVSDSLNGAYPSFRALKKARLVRIWIFMGDEFSPATQRFKKLNVGYNHHRYIHNGMHNKSRPKATGAVTNIPPNQPRKNTR